MSEKTEHNILFRAAVDVYAEIAILRVCSETLLSIFSAFVSASDVVLAQVVSSC